MAGIHLHDVTVLSKEEFARMNAALHRKETEEAAIRQKKEREEELHNLSVETVEHWDNTVIVSFKIIIIIG